MKRRAWNHLIVEKAEANLSGLLWAESGRSAIARSAGNNFRRCRKKYPIVLDQPNPKLEQ